MLKDKGGEVYHATEVVSSLSVYSAERKIEAVSLLIQLQDTFCLNYGSLDNFIHMLMPSSGQRGALKEALSPGFPLPIPN